MHSFFFVPHSFPPWCNPRGCLCLTSEPLCPQSPHVLVRTTNVKFKFFLIQFIYYYINRFTWQGITTVINLSESVFVFIFTSVSNDDISRISAATCTRTTFVSLGYVWRCPEAPGVQSAWPCMKTRVPYARYFVQKWVPSQHTYKKEN